MKSALRLSPGMLVAVVAFVANVSTVALAGTSRFDAGTLTLEIPCLEIVNDGEATGANGEPLLFRASMKFDGKYLVLGGVEAISAADTECITRFDMATNTFTDRIRFGDNIYDAVLTYESGGKFSPQSIKFRERGETSLWRVSDGVNELFIGGTIHILKPSDFPLPELFLEAYRQADILVTEVSKEDRDGTVASTIQTLVSNPDGLLLDYLSDSTVDALDAALAGTGYTALTFNYTRPVWVGQNLINLKARQLGYGPGVDDFFFDLAAEEGRTNVGLETTVFQIGAVNRTKSYLTPEQIVASALDAYNSDDLDESLRAEVTAWREGDLDTLAANVAAARAESLADYNIIYKDRNDAWVPQIEDYLATAPVEIILVGVSHLAGDDSVLRQLKALGYTVERYK